METVEIAEGIFRIKNVFPEDIYNKIYNFLKNSTDEVWDEQLSADFWRGNTLRKHLFAREYQILHKRIASFFPDDYLIVDPFFKTFRQQVGQEALGYHNDQVSDQIWNIWGTTTYFNDDFEGGELVYPELNMELKPVPNSTVVHSALVNHYVKPVTAGNPRYFIVTQVQDLRIPYPWDHLHQ